MKKKLIIIAINTLFLAAFLVCHVISAGIAAPLLAGRAVTAWAGQSGERFAQLAVHFPPSYGFGDEAIHKVRTSLDTALLAVSLEARDGRTLYSDAWSADYKGAVVGGRGSVSDASIIGIGGDFFLFHPLYLRNGSYLSPSDLMRDRVVLDEELAWRLYGSVQLAGLEVLVDGRPFVIAGVVSRERGFANDKAYDGGAGLFMSFEALSALSDGRASINSYEIVMPDVVTNFALDSFAAALDDDTLYITDNTARFSYGNLFNLLGTFGERSIRSDAIALPYWENAYRFAEDWLALLLLISLIMIATPSAFGVFYSVKLIRYGIKHGIIALKTLLKKRERRFYQRYMQKQNTL